jgi:hypothetical protein
MEEESCPWIDYFLKEAGPWFAPPRDQNKPIIPFAAVLPDEKNELVIWSNILEPDNVSVQFRCLAGMLNESWERQDLRAAFIAELEALLQSAGPYVPPLASGELTARATNYTLALEEVLEHVISTLNLDVENAFAFIAYERPYDKKWIVHAANEFMEPPVPLYGRVLEKFSNCNAAAPAEAEDNVEDAVAEAMEVDEEDEDDEDGEDI